MHLRLRNSSRKTVYTALSVILIYWILLKKRRYTETFELIIESVEPKQAWGFIADFTNLMKLNPTMNDLEIYDEKGNYALWEYSVYYKEHLVWLPFIHHDNRATYKVSPESKQLSEPFRIDSEHTCCIFYFFCLHTDAEMTFQPTKDSQSTRLEETIHYECPTILSPICRQEVKSQRKLIYDKILAADMSSVA